MTQHSLHDFILAVSVDEVEKQVTLVAYDLMEQRFYLLAQLPLSQTAKRAWRNHVEDMARRN